MAPQLAPSQPAAPPPAAPPPAAESAPLSSPAACSQGAAPAASAASGPGTPTCGQPAGRAALPPVSGGCAKRTARRYRLAAGKLDEIAADAATEGAEELRRLAAQGLPIGEPLRCLWSLGAGGGICGRRGGRPGDP